MNTLQTGTLWAAHAVAIALYASLTRLFLSLGLLQSFQTEQQAHADGPQLLLCEEGSDVIRVFCPEAPTALE